jgi:hypothetical protein
LILIFRRGILEDNDMNWMCKACPYFQKCANLSKKNGIAVRAATT